MRSGSLSSIIPIIAGAVLVVAVVLIIFAIRKYKSTKYRHMDKDKGSEE